MITKKDWTEPERRAVEHVKNTFQRELMIRRQKPYEFLKSKRMIDNLNNLKSMLEGKSGCSLLTLARIADVFGYDIELVKRPEEYENNN